MSEIKTEDSRAETAIRLIILDLKATLTAIRHCPSPIDNAQVHTTDCHRLAIEVQCGNKNISYITSLLSGNLTSGNKLPGERK